jgi:nucleolar complex protein 2
VNWDISLTLASSLSTDSKKFRTLAPMLKSHFTSVHHLLDSLSDAATLRLTLASILPLLPYVLSFKPVVRNLIKSVVVLWSSSTSNEATRIAAFLILRRLVIIGDAGLRESVLKGVYQGLVRGSRNTTSHTLPGVNLMKNSAAELWGLDPTTGYTTGFTFIRQLAVHLRTTITNPTADSYKSIYNWQYVHSLDFWSRVLSEHCASLKEAETGKESALRPLIYPAVQVTVGAMRLIPTSQYFPLRFHLIRSLLRISRATTTYIPLGPALHEVLQSNEMRKPPKQSTLRPLDFKTSIRAPKQYLKTRVYQDGLGEQVCELLSEFFVLWCRNIAFPELALPVVVLVKRWLRDAQSDRTGNRNNKVNSGLRLVLQKVESNVRFVEERRAKVDFAPGNRAGVEAFLREVAWEKMPLGAFVVGQRGVREEREKVVEGGRRAEERKRRAAREEGDDDEGGVQESGGGFIDAEEEGSGSEEEEGEG